MLVAIIFSALLSVVWLCVYLIKSRFNNFAKEVGGPKGLPLIGVLHRLLSMKDILYILPKWTGENKSAFFWMGQLPTYYTYDPERIEQILNSPECINKSLLYNIIDRELGSGIISSKSPKWDKHRKLVNPCFSHKTLVSFFGIFNEKSNELLEKLDTLVGYGETDLWQPLIFFSLKTSYATTMGKDVSSEVEKDLTFISHVERYLHTVFERSLCLLMRFNLTYRFYESYKPYQESKKIVQTYVSKVLTKKLADTTMKLQEDLKNNNESVDIVKPTSVFVDQFVDSHTKNKVSWQDVANETYVVIAASFETSATTLYNILMLVAMHPDYQDKLFEEVLSVFPDKDFEVEYKHLADLVYMDMFIKENLRVAPSVPLISREVSKDAKIGNLLIPYGTVIIMDIFNLHRREDIWGPDAKKFDPENFLPKNQDNKHSYSYIPFSKGPRNCIGWRYANMFLKVALSKIIRNFRISTSFRYEDLRHVEHLSLRYEVQPKLEIHRR